MANEVTVTAALKNENGKLSLERRLTNEQFDQSAQGWDYQVQNIGTTHEALDISSDISTAGWAYFRNLDDTNFVEVGVQDGSSNFIAFAKLKPGEMGVIRVATSDIYAQADTAAVDLEWWVLED